MGTTGISVVVPVYNPGEYIQRTIDSLLRQTLSPDAYEIVFVDDGSTDGTGQRLDDLAAEYPGRIRVEHIPNSGWPGRPRNVGTELARFDYVFYCDADDWLPDDSLELLLARIEADGSDLVVSRAIGNRRAVPQVIFERGDFCTTWRKTPAVFTNLTVQKLFRREFLQANGLRFCEGKVRLEDFIFMTSAYLSAERISVLGSRPCYVLEKRDDAGNLTATPADTDDYFASVEKILDVIEAHTEPGADRDVALDRLVRSELIASATGPAFLRRDEPERVAVFERVRTLLRDRVPDSTVAKLNAATRRRVRAILDGDRALVEAWTAWDAAVTADIRCSAGTWVEGKLRLELQLAFERDGSVIRLSRAGDRLFAPGPPQLAPDEPDLPAGVEVTAEARKPSVHVALRSRDISEQWRVRADADFAPGASSADFLELRFSANVEFDVSTIASDRPLRPQIWDVFVQLGAVGVSRQRHTELVPDALPPAAAVLDGLVVVPYRTANGRLSLDVGEQIRPLAAELVRRGVAPVNLDGDVLTMPLPLVVVGSAPEFSVLLTASGASGVAPLELAGSVETATFPARLRAAVPALPGRPRWSAQLRYRDGKPAPLGLDIIAHDDGTPRQLAASTSAPDPKDESMTKRKRPVSWRRRLAKLAARMGVSVIPVAPGALLVSRAGEADYHSEPLVRGHMYLLGRRRGTARNVLALKPGIAVVAGGTGAPPALHQASVGRDAWVVTSGTSVDVAKIGDKGALVAARDLPPREALTLETDMLRRLGEQHLGWLLSRYRVDCVIDVGANNGQYGRSLRRQGFTGHIISVEPVPQFAEKVTELAAGDERWTVAQIALGESDGVVPIRVQRTFSSALPASDYGKKRFATLREFADDEQIEVPLRRLDSVLDEWLAPVIASGVSQPRVFLKMDTQGLDLQVFGGLGERVRDIVGMQSEVALLLIYESMPRMPEAIATYEAAGFEISGLYPVTREPDGRVIEYDCTMVRAGELPKD
jgi:poly(ribitol-phosphate) beta-N-acetylglucosaminyltransferase